MKRAKRVQTSLCPSTLLVGLILLLLPLMSGCALVRDVTPTSSMPTITPGVIVDTPSTQTPTPVSVDVPINKPFIQRYISDIAISPSYAADGVVFATVWNGGLFRSTDKGVSWQEIAGSYQMCNRPTAVAISPNFGSDGVVSFGGSTWTRPDAYGSRLLISLDGGSSWKEQIEAGGEYFSAIAYSPSFIKDRTYFIVQWGAALEKIVFDDNSWSLDWDSVTALDSAQLSCGTLFVHDVAVSPNYSNDQTLYLANSALGLCKSVDGGASWTNLTDDINVVAVALSPSYTDDSTVIAGTTEQGLLVSRDGGLSWMTPTGVPTNHWTDIEFSPSFAKDDTIFASSTWGVFISTDRGVSWSAVNNGLTDFYVEALAISPDYKNDSTLFAGTHMGIFKSTDSGSSWKLVSTDIDVGLVNNVTTNPRMGFSAPSIALDSAGHAHVAGGGSDLYYQNNVGNAFGDPVRISVPDTEGHDTIEVSIAVDSNNKVHIAFRTAAPGTPVGNTSLDQNHYPIYYTNSRNGEFSAPALVIPSSWVDGLPLDYEVANPYIAVGPNGYAHVAFEAIGGSGGRSIYYTNNKSGAFVEPVLVPPTDLPRNIPHYLRGLAVDNTGRVHVISWQYGEEQDSRLEYASGVDGVFETSIVVATDVDMYFSSLAVDVSGNAYIVYRDSQGALYYTSNSGEDFGELTKISGSGHRPTIAVDELGHVHIVSLRQVLLSNEIQYWTNTEEAFNGTLITDIGFGIAAVGQRWMAVRGDMVHIVFNNGRVGGGSSVGIFPSSSSAIPSTSAYMVGVGGGPEVYYTSAPITTLIGTEP